MGHHDMRDWAFIGNGEGDVSDRPRLEFTLICTIGCRTGMRMSAG